MNDVPLVLLQTMIVAAAVVVTLFLRAKWWEQTAR